MVLLSVQGMEWPASLRLLHQPGPRPGGHKQLQRGRFQSLYPRYSGGRPPTFTLPQCQGIKKVALSWPVDHGLTFSTWSLAKLAEFLVAEGGVDDISHEGRREVLKRNRCPFKP